MTRTNRTRRYSTVNLTDTTLATVDQARAALSGTRGTLSRAAFVAAAVDHYVAALADDGVDVDCADIDGVTDLSGTKMPFRPAADWALVDDTVIPNKVWLATGSGPGKTAVLTVTAEILPHLTRGRFGGWKEMLRLAGYRIDTDRELDEHDRVLDDGRVLVPVTV